MGEARVTIADLARRLCLSQSAVSYALNGAPGVSETTRERVRAMAREMGWRPSSAARSLRSRRSRAIGVVLTRHAEQLATEPFYYRLIAGLETVLSPRDYSLLLSLTESGPAAHELYRQWSQEQKVDGVVLFDLVTEDSRIALLEELGIPMVLMGEVPNHSAVLHVAGHEDTDSLVVMQHVASLGHENIGFLGGPVALVHEQARRRGMRRAARLTGARLVQCQAEYTIEGGRRAAADLLARHPQLTALICSSDLICLGALQACRAAGLQVPQDISLVSWDDSIPMAVVTPAITALDRDPAGMGKIAARLLVGHLEDGPLGGAPTEVTSSLVIRESTGPLRAPGRT